VTGLRLRRAGSPPTIPAGAKLNFEVELFGWAKDVGKMDTAEKIVEAEKCKTASTTAFKASDFKAAAAQYTNGFKYVWETCAPAAARRPTAQPDWPPACLAPACHVHVDKCSTGVHDEHSSLGTFKEASTDAFSNRLYADGDKVTNGDKAANAAAAQLKTGDNAKALENCEKVLQLDPANVKAMFRKGKVRDVSRAKAFSSSIARRFAWLYSLCPALY
jgi:hypothetical protein